ncbi:MAG: diguanylate cyclase [Acidimicrobiia bacterium]|nr:diguanylate cyclase [Acidimicrobiia bacterium]
MIHSVLVGAVVVLLGLVVLLLYLVVHDHRRLIGQIEAQDSQLVTILDGLPTAVMLRAAGGRLLHANQAAERFVQRLGLEISHIEPSPASMLDHVEVVDEAGHPVVPAELPVVASLRDRSDRDATLGYALPGGGFAWYAVRAASVPLRDGTSGTVMTCDDVTERHEARQRTERAEGSLRRTFENAPIGIAVISPEGLILEVNRALCELLGRDEQTILADGLDGATDGKQRVIRRQRMADWLATNSEELLVEREFVHTSGAPIFTQMSIAAVRREDGSVSHLIAQIVDLRERRALEEELRDAAMHDPLTGLSNRRALAPQLTDAQQRHDSVDGRIGLVYLDLDGFKAVNDVHGHDAGDRVLMEMGRRLVEATRTVDVVCRMGGDEFVVLCTSIDGARGVRDLVARIGALLPLRVQLYDETVVVQASVGAVIVRRGEGLDAALHRADAAMYAAKRGAPPATHDDAPAIGSV